MNASRRWKSLSVLVLLLGAIARPGLAPAGELVDSIIATVGNEAILFSDLSREMQAVRNALQDSNLTAMEQETRFQKELLIKLNDAIEAKVLIREAEKADLAVSDEFVESYIEETRESFDTDEEFINYLRDFGETMSDYRSRIRKQLMAGTVARNKREALGREILISEDAIREYYEEHQDDDDYLEPERVQFQQILILSRRNSPERAEAKALLGRLRTELRGGADFSELAKQYSQADGAEEGGIVGWGERGDFIEVVEDVLFSMSTGEVSEIIEYQFGALIVRLIDREAEQRESLEGVRTRIEMILHEEAVQERYQKYLQDLRQRHRVRVFS